MGVFLQFAFLLLCWLAALATLLIFLETWFAFSGRNRITARRASGTYGVISIFVPMYGPPEKVERAIRSIFGQSYPFLELFLIYAEDEQRFADMAKEFRNGRSHIPVRLIGTTFPIDSAPERTRALEQVEKGARGRWFVVLDPDVVLDRFAIETAVEFAGSNEMSALILRPGIRCRHRVQSWLAPSMEHLLETLRIASRRREKRNRVDLQPSFLLLNREAFNVVNDINRMPGILNDAGWNIWAYEVEDLRTYEGDGSSWIWRNADVRSWVADSSPDPRRGRMQARFVIASAVMGLIVVAGLGFGITHRLDNFVAASIFAFSAVSYLLMAISYFLFARKLRAAGWFAPLWFVSHLPAVFFTLREMRNAHSIPTERRTILSRG